MPVANGASVTSTRLVGPGDPHAGEALPSLVPNQSFGPRYRIVKPLGFGGMGGVYQARDDVLGIDVALKVIRPEFLKDQQDAGRFQRRFKRELLLARRVSHPNVVRIHDIGEVGGVLYLTMSFVEGTDLATVLVQEGRLGVERALRILRQLADGLAAVHAAGVIHRDLKPANVMLGADDTPAIMDFGVARLEEIGDEGPDAAGTGGSGRTAFSVTSPGSVVGTMAYMAPEQAAGQSDPRSDVYALGLIAYDLVLGRRRLESPGGPLEDLERRKSASPVPLHEVDPDVPEPFSDVVQRCLAVAPANRPQTAARVASELRGLTDRGQRRPDRRRWWGGAVAAGLLASALTGTWWGTRVTSVALPDPLSVLVADFENQTGEGVFDGTVEQALTIALEDAPFISAYPRAGARGLAAGLALGGELDAEAARLIAAREGVTLVLTGGIVGGPDGYELTVTAADPTSDREAVDAGVHAVAAAASADEVLPAVRRLAADLRVALGEAADAGELDDLAEVYTTASLEAMSAYTRAQRARDAGREAEALAAYQEAVTYDPSFGRAHAGIGALYGNQRDLVRAEQAYQTALQHLDRMSERERYRTLAGYHLVITRDYRAAAEALRTLVELYPVDNGGRSNLALVSLLLRDVDEAVRHGLAALELYRSIPYQQANYAAYLMYAGRFAEAIEESDRVLVRLQESDGGGYVAALARHTVALSHAVLGDYPGARRGLEALEAADPFARSMALLASADLHLYRGESRQASEELQAAVAGEGSSQTAVLQVTLAEALWAAGEPARAVDAAQTAVALTTVESVQYAAGRVLLAAGRPDEARALADGLAAAGLSQTVAFARLLEGEIALADRAPALALQRFREGQAELDVWFAPVLVGQALFELGEYAAARDEWARALARRGEATDVFIEDRATLRYLPPVYYWLARAHEALGERGEAAEAYQRYLELRGQSQPLDALAEDSEQRLRRWR